MTMPILIVDDYNTMIRIVRNLLRQLGFTHIDEASDARTALSKMRNKHYGLVISDCNMAPMSGLELLKQVRAEERTKHMPFVMLANESGDDAAAVNHAGASSLILKPFGAPHLKRTLEGVLGAF